MLFLFKIQIYFKAPNKKFKLNPRSKFFRPSELTLKDLCATALESNL